MYLHWRLKGQRGINSLQGEADALLLHALTHRIVVPLPMLAIENGPKIAQLALEHCAEMSCADWHVFTNDADPMPLRGQ